MKKLLSLLITLSMLLSSVVSVNADSEITVNLNGKKITFDQPPIIQNDRTLVPMRKIFEAMDCEVEWDDEGIINIWKNGENIMFLRIGGYGMWVPGRTVELDVPPIIVNDRTLVPVRAISESMGAEVIWDGDTRTVDIYYSEISIGNDTDCEHLNTTDATLIDVKDYKNTGSATTHKVINFIDTVCNDCGQLLNTTQREKEEPHNFVNNVCIDCGYEKQSNCSHSSTKDVISIDERECENTGSSTTHKVTDKVIVYCNDCDEQVNIKYMKSEKSHNFEDDICVDCGYESDQTTQTEDYIELRNANLFDQYGDHPSSNCMWSSGNKLKFHIFAYAHKSEEYGLKLGDKTCICVEYNLNGQYSKMTGQILGSSSPAYMNIYVDGEKRLMTERMGSSSSKDITLDLSGAKILKFEAYAMVNNSVVGLYPDIYLNDVKLWY